MVLWKWIKGIWAEFLNLPYERTLFFLSASLAFCGVMTLIYVSNMSMGLIENKSVRDAARLAKTIDEFRTLYTSEVVERVRSKGVAVTHDYYLHPGAIPLPATLSLKLAQAISDREQGQFVRLYSEYPFPWRKHEGGPKDDFEREALIQLKKNPEAPFYRLEKLNQRTTMRFAVADRMRPACINCHAVHPDSPKRDWKLGDVRGVLEIALPIELAIAESQQGLFWMFFMLAGMSTVGVVGIGLTIKRLDQNIAEKSRLYLESQAAVSVRDDFMSIASHELKAPLTPIRMQIDFVRRYLLADAPDSPKIQSVRKLLEQSDSEVIRLSSMIDRLLDVTRISAGKLDLQTESVRLDLLVNGVVDRLGPESKLVGSAIEIKVNGEVQGQWDRLRIEQVIINLLTNAIRYGKGKPILIEVNQLGDKAVLMVTDQGIGITQADQEKIFNRFSRVTQESYGVGLGLGLYISKEIVLAHGGTITVQSQLDKGTRFIVELPLAHS